MPCLFVSRASTSLCFGEIFMFFCFYQAWSYCKELKASGIEPSVLLMGYFTHILSRPTEEPQRLVKKVVQLGIKAFFGGAGGPLQLRRWWAGAPV